MNQMDQKSDINAPVVALIRTKPTATIVNQLLDGISV